MARNNPEYAVRFGETLDKGGIGPKAYPFFYSFVNSEDDGWNLSPSAMGSIGPLVAAGATVEHAIKVSPDTNFKMLHLKYSAYYNSGGTYLWYDTILAGGDQLLEQADFQTYISTPLTHYLQVSLSVHGPDGRYLYGGANLQNNLNGMGSLHPIRIDTLQGYEYGMGQVRTEYLVPRNALIKVQITNVSLTKALYVTGMIYGMKVRV